MVPAEPRLLATVFSRASLSRCVPIALLVGTLLSLVNQGSVIATGDDTGATWARVVANFIVPFCVSSAGFYGGRRTAWRKAAAGDPVPTRPPGTELHRVPGGLEARQQPVLPRREDREDQEPGAHHAGQHRPTPP